MVFARAIRTRGSGEFGGQGWRWPGLCVARRRRRNVRTDLPAARARRRLSIDLGRRRRLYTTTLLRCTLRTLTARPYPDFAAIELVCRRGLRPPAPASSRSLVVVVSDRIVPALPRHTSARRPRAIPFTAAAHTRLLPTGVVNKIGLRNQFNNTRPRRTDGERGTVTTTVRRENDANIFHSLVATSRFPYNVPFLVHFVFGPATKNPRQFPVRHTISVYRHRRPSDVF